MKVGTDSPVKTTLAIVLVVIAMWFLARTYFRGTTSEAAPANNAVMVAKAGGKPVSSLDPTLRTDLLRSSEGIKYEAKGRNIFTTTVEIPQPTHEVMKTSPQPAPQPVVQGPPPINMRFIGFANKPGQRKQIFLMQNEDVFVATEGDIVNRRYKVVKINPNSVEIENVLNNNHQSIPLSQG